MAPFSWYLFCVLETKLEDSADLSATGWLFHPDRSGLLVQPDWPIATATNSYTVTSRKRQKNHSGRIRRVTMVTTCKNNSLLCVCVGGVSCFCPSIAPVYIICKSDLQIMKLFFFCKLLTQYSTPVCIGAACNLSNRVSSQPTYTPASFIKSRGTGPHLVTSPANKTADSFCHQRGALQQVRVLTFFG